MEKLLKPLAKTTAKKKKRKPNIARNVNKG